MHVPSVVGLVLFRYLSFLQMASVLSLGGWGRYYLGGTHIKSCQLCWFGVLTRKPSVCLVKCFGHVLLGKESCSRPGHAGGNPSLSFKKNWSKWLRRKRRLCLDCYPRKWQNVDRKTNSKKKPFYLSSWVWELFAVNNWIHSEINYTVQKVMRSDCFLEQSWLCLKKDLIMIHEMYQPFQTMFYSRAHSVLV